MVSHRARTFGQYYDVIKWKHCPRYWPFVRENHQPPVDSPHKGQWHGAMKFYLIFALTNGWANHRDAGDLRRYRAHDVTVMRDEFGSRLCTETALEGFTSKKQCGWGRYKMAAILQTIRINFREWKWLFSWMKMIVFRFIFAWRLFVRAHLTTSQQWFRLWLRADWATSHYVNQWRHSSLTYICVTRHRLVELFNKDNDWYNNHPWVTPEGWHHRYHGSCSPFGICSYVRGDSYIAVHSLDILLPVARRKPYGSNP